MPLQRRPRAASGGRSTRARPPLADSARLPGPPPSTSTAAPAPTATQTLPAGCSGKASGSRRCLPG
eukprot:15471304-Alexandrium_andersonii.AAC.1